MVFHQNVSWVRSHRNKLCPDLRKHILSWYRSTAYMPCFLNNALKVLRQRWHKIPVIVQLNKNAARILSVESLAESSGCQVKKNLPLIDSFASDVNLKSMQKLVENSVVETIWYDGEVRAMLDVASPAVKADNLWDLGYAGKGVGIAVLDTGIYNHPDLRDRIIGFKDFVKNLEDTYDDNGHGTHVAGCAAGSGNMSGNNFRGPASSANLIGVKVLNKLGIGSASTVIQGVQWCIYHKENLNIKILNLSLGLEASQPCRKDPVCLAAEKAWESGIVVCAAAGNSGPDSRTIASPGHSPVIITVGAINDNNTTNSEDDVIASFSSRGPTVEGLIKPDVVAPGVNIVSLRAPGSFIDKKNKETRVDGWHTSLSGTSMATPVCAGLIAQLLEINDTLTPEEVKSLLKSTAKKLAGFSQNEQGMGTVNGKKAADTIKID